MVVRVEGIAWTLGRPISALSAAGVPSATMWPWSMIPTRSASTSASSRYCVVRKTVTPSSRARRATSSHSAVRLCGSRPVVGSSRKRMLRPVDEREREVEPPLHAAGVAAHLAVGGVRRGRRGRAAVWRALDARTGIPCSVACSRSGRARSGAGRAPPPGARRRSPRAPWRPRWGRRGPRPAPCRRSAAAAS